MFVIKTPAEIEKMEKGGKIASQILRQLESYTTAGRTGRQTEEKFKEMLKEYSVESAFLGYQGYPSLLCFSRNEVLLHGIPNNEILQDGDLVTIDLGIIYKKLYLDTATSFLVGQQDEAKERFLQVGKKALQEAIDSACVNGFLGDISWAMQKTVEDQGLNVVKTYTGHGVGQKLHEPPAIPCFGKRGQGEKIPSPVTLAIEVMYMQGKPDLTTLDDGWTTITTDRSLCAMFEHTVLIDEGGSKVLT